MFTGIVECCGRIEAVEDRGGVRRLTVRANGFGRLPRGASVALNGTCLTVVEAEEDVFTVEAVPETLQRTNLGELQPGSPVNLERAARLGDRLDGHLVTGHVDATGVVAALEPDPRDPQVRWLKVQAPEQVMRFVVPKGPIAVDGISLTVVEVEPDAFTVTVIPYTWEVTNLRYRRPGDRVNLEADVVGKYVARLVEIYGGAWVCGREGGWPWPRSASST